MSRKIDWDARIGRRLKLKDLHVFFTVAQCGSMAKAAQQLGVSQPAISAARVNTSANARVNS
jgi:Bacterial regulatory helix-turn-helix protein, lysR family